MMSEKANATSLESIADALQQVINENPAPTSAPRNYEITRAWVQVGGVVEVPQYHVDVEITDV